MASPSSRLSCRVWMPAAFPSSALPIWRRQHLRGVVAVSEPVQYIISKVEGWATCGAVPFCLVCEEARRLRFCVGSAKGNRAREATSSYGGETEMAFQHSFASSRCCCVSLGYRSAPRLHSKDRRRLEHISHLTWRDFFYATYGSRHVVHLHS